MTHNITLLCVYFLKECQPFDELVEKLSFFINVDFEIITDYNRNQYYYC